MRVRTFILVGAVVAGVAGTQLFALSRQAAGGQPGKPSTSAQPGKRVYISADIEGISGVTGDDQTSPAGAEYARGRRLMTEDVNAAIRGALDGGATDILVNDSHGGMRNILPEELNRPAHLISHSFKRDGMMEGLDETFDAVILVGYHAKADSPVGLFAHTGSGVVRDVQINGRSVGEGGMNTLLAAWYGVPVVMVTGDDVAVAQVKEVAAEARGVAVKRAINLRAAELRPIAEAREDIQRTAREAVAGAKKFAPRRAGPYRWTVRFRTFLIPEVAEAILSVERPAPDTLSFSTESMPAGYRLFRVLYRYINPD
jgi:D-amino peptidase